MMVGELILDGVNKDTVEAWVLDNIQFLADLSYAELERLKIELRKRGAGKTYLDRTMPKLIASCIAESAAKALEDGDDGDSTDNEQQSNTGRFAYAGGRIVERTDDGSRSLCNFGARIVADVLIDDGEEVERKMLISGRLESGAGLGEIEIDAGEFSDMKWVTGKWGARAIIDSGRGAQAKLRQAIQELSVKAGIEQLTSYSHTGWRIINGKRVFLHAGGAIGMDGVQVKLPDDRLNMYRFNCDGAIDYQTAMRESLNLLDTAPGRITYPLLSAMYASILTEIIPFNAIQWIEGRSGSKKSSLSAVFLNHFGSEFTESKMPTDWLGTQNALEKLSYHIKDMPLIIDDFRPSDDPAQNKDLNAKATRIQTIIGNRSGRPRLNSKSELKKAYSPRGLIVSTAERGSGSQSGVARTQSIDVEPGDIDNGKLYAVQQKRHIYNYAMEGFIRYAADCWDTYSKELSKVRDEYRNRMTTADMHGRSPQDAATLFVSFLCVLDYAEKVGAIDVEEKKRRAADCYNALVYTAKEQAKNVSAVSPVDRFLTILVTQLFQRKAFISTKVGSAGFGSKDGDRLGWHDGENIYLTTAAYNAICKFESSEGKAFPFNENTLRKELARSGYITLRDADKDGESERWTLTARDPATKKSGKLTAINYAKFIEFVEGSGMTKADVLQPHGEMPSDTLGGMR